MKPLTLTDRIVGFFLTHLSNFAFRLFLKINGFTQESYWNYVLKAQVYDNTEKVIELLDSVTSEKQ